MEQKILIDGLRNILKICYKNGFFHLQSSGSSSKSVQYGPLGSLLRRNVMKEWLSSIVNNTDVCMFPAEVPTGNQLRSEQLHGKQSYLFFKGVLKNYFKTLPLTRVENPWGFAVYGPGNHCVQNSEEVFDNPFFSKLESRYCLSIIFFCPMKKSSDWFNYWTLYRYRWWRKFSSIPSKFSMSDVTETATGNQQISLMMEFPWGKKNLETVTLCNENFFSGSSQAVGLECIKNVNTSAVIICQSELDLATFAFLSNSFAEKWRDKEIRKLFHLHVKLAPYKVCLSVNADNSEDLKNLKDVAKHLEKELKKCQVAVFPCYEASVKDNISQFKQYDEMGVPYTIVLDKKALNSGIAGLRNRDTTLEEQIHIAELTPKILKYLQMKSYEVEVC